MLNLATRAHKERARRQFDYLIWLSAARDSRAGARSAQPAWVGAVLTSQGLVPREVDEAPGERRISVAIRAEAYEELSTRAIRARSSASAS